MDDAYCKAALYRAMARKMVISPEQFAEAFKNFSCREMILSGQAVGFIIESGNEVHIQIEKAIALKHAARLIREIGVPLLTRLGFITTRATTAESQFLKRLGFIEQDGKGELKSFIMTEFKLTRKSKCQF